MGKRSRSKQRSAAAPKRVAKPVRKPLGERIKAAAEYNERHQRPRPTAPWDPFPLTELAIFIGLVCMATGVLVGDTLGKNLLVVGVLLAAAGGLETAAREHFAGFRSHASLLAGVVGMGALAVTTAALHLGLPLRLGISIGLALTVYFPLRRTFLARSGGRRF